MCVHIEYKEDWGDESMNGYEIMSDSYKSLVKRGQLTEEEAAPKIRIYDFLSGCSKADICSLVDSSAFNDIICAYAKQACKDAELTEEQINKVELALIRLLDSASVRKLLEEESEGSMTGNIYVDKQGIALSGKEEMMLKCIYDHCDEHGKNAEAMLVNKEFCEIYGKSYGRTTLTTFLGRLEQKGFVKRHHIGRNMRIDPKLPKEEYVKVLVDYALNFLCDGNIVKALSYLLEGKSPEEKKQCKQALLAILEERENV